MNDPAQNAVLVQGAGLLALATFGPLFAAVVAFLAPRIARVAGSCAALVAAVASVALAATVHRTGAFRVALGGWGAPVGLELSVDGLAAVLIATFSLVGLCITVYAGARPPRGGDDNDPAAATFMPLWLLLLGGLNVLVVAADLFTLYVCLELTALSAVGLTALGGRLAHAAAMRYLVQSLTGSLFWLMGVALIYGQHGALDLGILAGRVGSGASDQAALALMAGALLLKAAIFPMHGWLPPAHANAPAPASAALSALVVKAAFYVLLRVGFSLFPSAAAPALPDVLGVLGLCAVVWGSVQALRAERLKVLVAWSTVAQLGLLCLVFPMARLSPEPAGVVRAFVLLAVSHAFAKAALFLAAGTVLRVAGHDRIADLAEGGRRLEPSLLIFAIAGLALIGVPPGGGFVAKWLVLEAAFAGAGWGFAIVVLGGGLLSAAYLFRVMGHAFARREAASPGAGRLGIPEWAALALALTALGLGLFAQLPLGVLDAAPPLGAAR